MDRPTKKRWNLPGIPHTRSVADKHVLTCEVASPLSLSTSLCPLDAKTSPFPRGLRTHEEESNSAMSDHPNSSHEQ